MWTNTKKSLLIMSFLSFTFAMSIEESKSFQKEKTTPNPVHHVEKTPEKKEDKQENFTSNLLEALIQGLVQGILTGIFGGR